MRSADQNSEGGSRSKYGKSRAFVSKYGIVIAFVIFCLILSISTKGRFLVIDNVLNVLRQVSINGVLAIGMTFVILTGGIDLSVGAVVALTGFVCANVYKAGWTSCRCRPTSSRSSRGISEERRVLNEW